MAGKKSLILYHDIREPLEQLTMEQRGELFTAILDYSENGTLPTFTGELRMAFAFIRSSMDRNSAAWEETRRKRAEAGRLGGLAKVANAKNAKQNKQDIANVAVSVPVSVSDNMRAAQGRPTFGPAELPELCQLSPETKVAPWARRER